MHGIDVAIIGAGALGAYAAEFLARRREVSGILVLDRDGDLARGIAWRARLGAAQEGLDARIAGEGLDAGDVEATAALLDRAKPRIILHSATILTVRELAQRLRPETFARIRATGMAGFLPAHLYLGVRLQSALAQLTERPILLTAPFPDFTNQILGRFGPPPLTGIGNIDNVASELVAMAAETRGVAVEDVQALVIAHHSVAESFQRTGIAGPTPWHAHVTVDGRDVTGDLDIPAMMAESSARMRKVLIEARVASSAVKAIMAALSGHPRMLHGAGPAGRPGGWPMRLRSGQAEIVLPPGIGEHEALAMNLAGQTSGGLAAVESDGTMVMTPAVTSMMRDLFEIDVARVPPVDLEASALALRAAVASRIAEGG